MFINIGFICLVFSHFKGLSNANGDLVVTYYGNKTFSTQRIQEGDNTWISSSNYSPAQEHKSNFAQLKIKTNAAFNDAEQMFGAGFAEGYLTAESIWQHYQNMMCQVDCSGAVPVELSTFFVEQDSWARANVEKNKDCSYWQFIGGLLSQMDGLMEGYSASAYVKEQSDKALNPWAFIMINSLGDLFDILPAVTPAKRPLFHKMKLSELRRYQERTGHCSALVKLQDDQSEMFMAHNAWFVYSAMLRIWKVYEMPLRNSDSKTTVTSFSSYPATLSSLDDFYMMRDSQIVMLQTTNNVFNSSLWDLIVPQSLLAWQRVRTANQLASTGPDWYKIVQKHNSGTYNNQYMIIDTKLFTPGQALQPNTLFVCEQIPGMMQGSDVTSQLERGYWPSYNVPYHQDIYNAAGYPMIDEKQGVAPYTQYQMAPRATIFRRDQSSVKDMKGMQYIMRYNDFEHDPASTGSGWDAISARGDLVDPKSGQSPSAGGGYDTKITTWSRMVKSSGSKEIVNSARIINGPTAQGQPPFKWSSSGLDTPGNMHIGQVCM